MENSFDLKLPQPESSVSDKHSKQKILDNLSEIYSKKLPQAETLKEFYQLVQEIMTNVNLLYQNIQCKSGCSRCCKFYGSPHVFDSEWENIKDFVENKMDQKQRKIVYRKFKESIDELKQILEDNVAKNTDDNSFSVATFLLSECPFLYKNMCSIYEARPLICRVFGTSLITYPERPEVENVLACVEERDRWKDEHKNIPAEKINLPYKEQLIPFLIKIGKTENYSTIQYLLSEYFNEY
jgi:Fe-S-cluster containining protein